MGFAVKLKELQQMKLECSELEEHEDGSATLVVEMDEETKLFMINHAVLDLLEKAIWAFKRKFDDNTETVETSLQEDISSGSMENNTEK